MTALSELGSQGFLIAAQGQKCMVRGLKEDGTLLPVAFMDMQCYITAVKEMPGTGLCLMADAVKGVWLTGYYVCYTFAFAWRLHLPFPFFFRPRTYRLRAFCLTFILGSLENTNTNVFVQEEPYQLRLFSKSPHAIEVLAADFLPDGKQLYLVAADADGNIHVLQFDPEGKLFKFLSIYASSLLLLLLFFYYVFFCVFEFIYLFCEMQPTSCTQPHSFLFT